MSALHMIVDREVEVLLGECNDAGMMRDYDRFTSLFTEDGSWLRLDGGSACGRLYFFRAYARRRR
jgi:hypothetical protein